MKVSIPDDLMAYIDGLVSSGAFASREAVIAEALRHLTYGKARFEDLKAGIDESLADVDRTGGPPVDFEEVKRKGRKRLTASTKP